MVCFTFDVEEHYRIEAAAGLTCSPSSQAEYARRMEAATRRILDLLAETSARCTMFLVGQIARSHPKLVRLAADAGHEIACHSWDHRRLIHFTPEAWRKDLRTARAALEQAAGQPVVGFRAPTFSLTRTTAWAIDILAEEGFRYDSSIFPVRHDRYGVPDAPTTPFWACGPTSELLELPPLTWRVGPLNLPVAGGGYFRLFPSALFHAAIRRCPGPAILYFHPWEFDPRQPRLRLPTLSSFRTYVGIHRTLPRLRCLLRQYGSRPLRELVATLPLTALPRFDLTT